MYTFIYFFICNEIEEIGLDVLSNFVLMPKQNILEAQIADLEQESSHPDFWNDPNDPRTKKVNQELASKNKAFQTSLKLTLGYNLVFPLLTIRQTNKRTEKLTDFWKSTLKEKL